MKALSSSKKPNIVVIVSVATVILIGIGLYVYFINKPKEDLPTNPQGTVKEDQVASDSPSQSNLPQKVSEKSIETTPRPPTETPATPPEKPTIERASGSPTIKVVATFQKASPGSCELQLNKPGQKTVSQTTPIIISSSYYVCSFSLARSTLSGDGDSWNATVIHHVGTASTVSDPRSIE